MKGIIRAEFSKIWSEIEAKERSTDDIWPLLKGWWDGNGLHRKDSEGGWNFIRNLEFRYPGGYIDELSPKERGLLSRIVARAKSRCKL